MGLIDDTMLDSLTDGINFSIADPPFIAKRGDFLLMEVTKIWGDYAFRIGTDDTKVGVVFEPMRGSLAVVLVPLCDNPNEDVLEEEFTKDDQGEPILLKDVAMTMDQFMYFMKQRAILELAFKQAKNTEAQKGF